MSKSHGSLYLLHFDPPYRSASGKIAGHYLGWSKNGAESRVREHLSCNGKSSPLVKAAVAQGCVVTLVRTWVPGDRPHALRLKAEGQRWRRLRKHLSDHYVQLTPPRATISQASARPTLQVVEGGEALP